MLAIDPLLANPPDDDGSDYEYEYHDTETETFFLNLDLTTHHGAIRPARRRNDPSDPSASASTATGSAPAPARADDQDPTVSSSETDNASADRVQILGLHTPNPIISYQNQIFSGAWADQIGTELFFSRPNLDAQFDDDPDSAQTDITPLKHTKDFDLIAANSVKILGRKANLISSFGSTQEQQTQQPQQEASSDQQQQQQQQQREDTISSAPASVPETVYKPEHQTNQARFLNRLMDIKRSRGETDTVRTVFSTMRRGTNLEERLRGWAQTDEQLAVIQQLNDRALQGDSEAIMELENIYAQLGGQDPGPGPSEEPFRSET